MASVSAAAQVACAVACFSAFGVGACLGRRVVGGASRRSARNARRGFSSGSDAEGSFEGFCPGLAGKLLGYAASMSRRSASSLGRVGCVCARASERFLAENARQAGLADFITPKGFGRARIRAALAASALGALFGAVFSVELASLLAVAGAAVGWRSFSWAVRRARRMRTEELERHLPEMLEVVALGLRSGLSFDRSLELYASHFDTMLSRSMASAMRRWSLGLARRDEALRDVAQSYDSPLFSRAVENIVRSLRFGAALAEGLEAAAAEARAAYRARKQEQVAKAPVKMMLPTGALMLPAMLILVLGPVLLELMDGF